MKTQGTHIYHKFKAYNFNLNSASLKCAAYSKYKSQDLKN